VRAKEIIRTEIERHAELGRPDLAPVLDHGEPIRWPTAALNHLGRQRLDAAVGQADTFDGLAVLIWLFKPQLIDALEKEIDAIADDAAALSEARGDATRIRWRFFNWKCRRTTNVSRSPKRPY